MDDTLTMREGLAVEEIEQRIGRAWAAAGLRHRVVAYYLYEVDSRRLYQLEGHASTVRYAMAKFGMSRREARDLLLAGTGLQELPKIDEAFRTRRLSWSKVRELVKVATTEHDERWLDFALSQPIEAVALETKLAGKGDPPRDRDDRKGLPEIRINLRVSMPPDVHAKWEATRRRLEALHGGAMEQWEYLDALLDLGLALEADDSVESGHEKCSVVVHADSNTVETDDGEVPIAAEIAEMHACDCGVIHPGDADARSDRPIPEAMNRKLMARDGGRCRCCRSRIRLQRHHIIPYSEGGPTELANLIVLCRGCHARVHAGLLTILGDAATARFLDRHGRDLHGPEPAPDQFLDAEEVTLAEATATAARKVAQCATRLADLVGQDEVVRSMRIGVGAAKRTGEAFGHTLLAGPPGLGKTTIARAVAAELGTELHATSGPLLKDPAALLTRLDSIRDRDVLFIDEIHAIPDPVAEVLYERMDQKRFTVIGATTDAGLLPEPFVSRFVYQENLTGYTDVELARLARRVAQCATYSITPAAALALGRVSRQTPRQALRLLKLIGDETLDDGCDSIDAGRVRRTLKRLGIDGRGLGPIDHSILELLRAHGPNQPISLARLAAMLNVSPRTIERFHEPYLFRLGLVTVTPQGRVAT